MKAVTLLPSVHFFVCVNRREADAPLGAGCGDRGDAVYQLLKGEVARRGAHRTVWVTQTRCLGSCPKTGTTVAVYPPQALYVEVEPGDAAGLFAAAVDGRGGTP